MRGDTITPRLVIYTQITTRIWIPPPCTPCYTKIQDINLFPMLLELHNVIHNFTPHNNIKFV
jgi:hypothetical protein